MKAFSISILTLCLVGVWSQNLLDAPLNLRSSQARRQAEEDQEAAAEPPAPAAAPPAPRPAASAPVARQSSGASSSSAYNLPDGSEIIVGAIKTTFSCSGRIYGYYADPDNNCQVFHVCVPHLDPENGIDETVQYSFFCGNQTVFDQESLVCTYPDDATPCSEAAGLYDQVNRNFGVTDRPFRQRSAGDEPTETTIKDTKEAVITKTSSTNGKSTTAKETTEK